MVDSVVDSCWFLSCQAADTCHQHEWMLPTCCSSPAGVVCTRYILDVQALLLLFTAVVLAHLRGCQFVAAYSGK